MSAEQGPLGVVRAFVPSQTRQGLEGDDIFAKGTTCHGDEAGVRAPMLELQHRTTSMRGLNLPTYLPGPSS